MFSLIDKFSLLENELDVGIISDKKYFAKFYSESFKWI